MLSAARVPDDPAQPRSLWRRLLRAPLLVKILVANGTVVALGATAGTYLTAQSVLLFPHASRFEMMVLFAVGGLCLSVGLNAAVLGLALRPLAGLERTARRVRDGDLDARVRPGIIGDPDTDQLAATFNAMLDRLRERTWQVEAYSSRLQELSDRVLLAQEEERGRLASRLLDDTGQVLATLLLHLRLLHSAAGQTDGQPAGEPGALARQVSDVTELARQGLDGVRTLAHELHPRLLDDLGLASALRTATQAWQAQTGVVVDFDCTLPADESVPAGVSIALYRMVQESLANVAAHARATRVTVEVACRNGQVVAEVRDDGRGLPAGRLDAAGPAPTVDPRSGDRRTGGLGLFSMQERIGMVGGQLVVESASGRGTSVRAVVPLPAVAPAA